MSASFDETARNLLRDTDANGGLKPRSDTDAWVSQRRSRILPCLPASNADLSRLAAQLRVDI